MSKNMLLSQAALNKKVIIQEILQNELFSKYLDMGFFENKIISVLFKAPFNDPIAIDMGGFVLSLRKDEASKIIVKYV